MLSYIAKKIFGTRNDRVLASVYPLVAQINELEARFQKLSLEDLARKTAEFRTRVANGESLDSILPEAFAVVREAGRRVLNMRHFDVQLIGGIILHSGRISEMKTGEGKTLVATLPAYLNALTGKGVHVVTVNDYLVRRDSEWIGRIYRALGMSVGAVYSGMNEQMKHDAYKSDITYGQNNEFGFDYLRDNMKFDAADQMQRGHNYAIVDEVDSILIDEARTPLIISGPADDPTDKYLKINKVIPYLKEGEHYEMELRSKQPTLTDAGIAKLEHLLSIANLYDPTNIELLHHVTQALRAHTTMVRDVDYMVKDGQIIIVDEFTGRLMPGRRWSDGLHQAIEAKEGVRVMRENRTLASITFQNYFRMYSKLSGMTGTADTEAVEFKKIYNLEVIAIPANMPMIRADETDRVFRTRNEKYSAVVEDIKEINATGQPVLVGTTSIEQSEALSKMLERDQIKHNVLNAKQHEREAEIVAQAGRFASVTIATNMAGRGTDILLGGNAEFLANSETGLKDRNDPIYLEALSKFERICKDEKEKVKAAGGLFILGTERHESRRIDNQLRGRAGRQGDPGCSRFYVSLEDDLMKRFGGDKIQSLMKKLGWEEGVAMDGRMISHSIETAQKRVESFHFESRKHVTEYDDVMNKQRQVVYNLRSKVLLHEGTQEEIFVMIDDLIEESVLTICSESSRAMDWDLNKLKERCTMLFKEPINIQSDSSLDQQTIFDSLRAKVRTLYTDRKAKIEAQLVELKALFTEGQNPFNFSPEEIEHDILLSTLDNLWLHHLQAMDYLREGIGLRGYGQKNPLYEYQKEGFVLFNQMLQSLKETVVRQLFHYELPQPKEYLAYLEAEKRRREELEKQMQLTHEGVAPEGASEQGNIEEEAPVNSKSPEDERSRLLAQKKARRRAKR